MYIDQTRYITTPDAAGRLEKEMAVYRLLEQLQMPFIRVDHDAANTIEDCAAVEQVLGTPICKNLFLRNRQATSFYLLLLPGKKRFVTRNFSRQLGISRTSFAEAEYMEKYLNITPGSVSILGLMNDTERKVQLIIDKELFKEKQLGFHPCINTSSLSLSLSDLLEKFLPYTGHTFTEIELSEE